MAWLTGLGSPLLWGTVAFLLNYVPILGPTAGVVIFLVAGLVTIEPLWAAFLPAGAVSADPCRRGRDDHADAAGRAGLRSTRCWSSIGVIFWYWMWGVAGAILSTPMLAITEDHLRPDRDAAAGRAFHRRRAGARDRAADDQGEDAKGRLADQRPAEMERPPRGAAFLRKPAAFTAAPAPDSGEDLREAGILVTAAVDRG